MTNVQTTARRLDGKTFVIVGEFLAWPYRACTPADLVAEFGGIVQYQVTSDLTYLVIGDAPVRGERAKRVQQAKKQIEKFTALEKSLGWQEIGSFFEDVARGIFPAERAKRERLATRGCAEPNESRQDLRQLAKFTRSIIKERPKNAEHLVSEAFIQYKLAQEGEIDWCPTEIGVQQRRFHRIITLSSTPKSSAQITQANHCASS